MSLVGESYQYMYGMKSKKYYFFLPLITFASWVQFENFLKIPTVSIDS